MPENLTNILNSNTFWKSLEKLSSILNPICSSIGFLESNFSSVSDVYAVFVYLRCVISNFDIDEDKRKYLDMKLIYKWKRIYSPVHALAFRCDHFYNEFRTNITKNRGKSLVDLDFWD